jgi:hypothetical protein
LLLFLFLLLPAAPFNAHVALSGIPRTHPARFFASTLG